MISNHDRSNYIGASDTKYVMSNWNTNTFVKWWLKKQGIDTSHFNNKYTLAGTNYEHKIIDALEIKDIKKDNQFIKGRLRVNLDANTSNKIYEIKTFQYDYGFDLKKHQDYIQQVQVQMYCSNIHNAEIVAYGLKQKDYDNYFNDIDIDRLERYEIEYDSYFIENMYLPRLRVLEECLINGKLPKEEMLKEIINGYNK